MKTNFKFDLSEESLSRLMYKIKSAGKFVMRWLLIEHNHVLDLITVLSVLLLAGIMFARVLLFDPGVTIDPLTEINLSDDDIDDVVLWLDNREDFLKNGLELPSRSVFKR